MKQFLFFSFIFFVFTSAIEIDKNCESSKEIPIVIDDDKYMELATLDTLMSCPVMIELLNYDTLAHTICIKATGASVFMNQLSIIANSSTDEKMKIVFLDYQRHAKFEEEINTEPTQIFHTLDLKKLDLKQGNKLIIKSFNCSETIVIIY